MKTKITIILFLLIIISGKTFCQYTNYEVGFSDGYKVGYCYGQGYNCITPIPPIAPLPRIGESSDSYFDGYNRGLLKGRNIMNAEIIQENERRAQSKAIYGQQQYIPKVNSFTPDYSFYEKTIQQTQQNYEQKKTDDIEFAKVEAYLDKLNTPESKAKRIAYINYVKLSYSEFKNFPMSIPDGWYKVINISNSSSNFGLFWEEEVEVENNRIIIIKHEWATHPGEFAYYPYIEKFTDYKQKITPGGANVITESSLIINGLGVIKTKKYFKETDNFFEDVYPEFKGSKENVYFLDYLNQYQNAQNCISETKRKYNLLTNYPKVQDGWNIVYANDGVDFCDIRKVFIENGKVTLYKNGEDKDMNVTSGGTIVNCKTTISYTVTWKDGTHPKTIITEIYFL